MTMTPEQYEYLKAKHLPFGVSELQIVAFIAALPDHERRQFDALAFDAGAMLSSVSLSAQKIVVDRAAGVIRRIPVITLGPTLPSAGGHDSMVVDRTTLRQVRDLINAVPAGTRSRFTHPEQLNGDVDDLPDRIGYFRYATLTDRAVLADFYAHNPTNDRVLVLMDIAENDPTACGVSIVSKAATAEPGPGGQPVLRVPSLDAIDFVSTPAANPRGLVAASATTFTRNFIR